MGVIYVGVYNMLYKLLCALFCSVSVLCNVPLSVSLFFFISFWIFTHLKLCLAIAIYNFKWVRNIQVLFNVLII